MLDRLLEHLIEALGHIHFVLLGLVQRKDAWVEIISPLLVELLGFVNVGDMPNYLSVFPH